MPNRSMTFVAFALFLSSLFSSSIAGPRVATIGVTRFDASREVCAEVAKEFLTVFGYKVTGGDLNFVQAETPTRTAYVRCDRILVELFLADSDVLDIDILNKEADKIVSSMGDRFLELSKK
jgi:hypothetical protein